MAEQNRTMVCAAIPSLSFPADLKHIHCFKMADGVTVDDAVEGQPLGAVSLEQQSPKSLL